MTRARPRGRELLKQRSPLTFADRISKPLLIAQGANDPRVKQAEADQIVGRHEVPETAGDPTFCTRTRAMASPVRRTESRSMPSPRGSWRSAWAVAPSRSATIFAGSSLKVNAGADYVDGLPAALKAMEASTGGATAA